MWEGFIVSHIGMVDDLAQMRALASPERGDLTPSRLKEHVQYTAKRLKKLGIERGDVVASTLPEGPDAETAAMALAAIGCARYVALTQYSSCEQFEAIFREIRPKLILMHPAGHPGDQLASQAARRAGIPIANVLRHFEAGVFTLEPALPLPASLELVRPVLPPAWKAAARGIPLVLIAPGLAYRRLAQLLDSHHPIIGITPPTLEQLPPPHTIEHIAAESVRLLRRNRPHGPYAFAGWQSDGITALEMARLLEEQGEKVAFVAMLNASQLFSQPKSRLERGIFLAKKAFRKKYQAASDFPGEALRKYQPAPWYGKILHISPRGQKGPEEGSPWFEWRDVAPHGVSSYEAPADMFAEPNVQTVAEILALELAHRSNAIIVPR